MKDEALKLALEALESVLANHNGAPVLFWIEARDAIKQALAAPVQPGRNHYEDGDVFERIAAMNKPPAAQPAPVQPVAWMSNKDFEPIRSRIMGEAYELAERDVEGYNAIKVMCGDVQKMLPAQRQWVGLTQDEFRDFASTLDYGTGGLIRAIEAKLRSKNT